MITRMSNSVAEALDNMVQLQKDGWNVEVYATGIFHTRGRVEYLDRKLVESFKMVGDRTSFSIRGRRDLTVFTGYAVFVIIAK